MSNKDLLSKRLLNDPWDILIIKRDGSWEFISPDLLDSRDKDTIHIIRRIESPFTNHGYLKDSIIQFIEKYK